MIITAKFFYDVTDEDREKNNQLWNDNESRMIILQSHLSIHKRMSALQKDIQESTSTKNILVLKNLTIQYIHYVMEEIKNNGGIYYGNKQLWFPNEIWIYQPRS